MHDGCEVYMDSYIVLNGSCFMVTWTIFKNHLLVVGLTQNRPKAYPNVESIFSLASGGRSGMHEN